LRAQLVEEGKAARVSDASSAEDARH
jgi:hypothetical protein